jgi:hypothetical protein
VIADLAVRPLWLTPELTATAAARAKLEDWTGASPRGAIADPCVYGDASLLPLLRGALGRLPPPARAYAIERAVFLLVGRQMRGWCGARPDCGDRWFVVLSSAGDDDEAFVNLCGHELAHAWLEEPPTAGMRCAPRDWRGSAAAGDESAIYAAAERRAEALAASWGFLGSGF